MSKIKVKYKIQNKNETVSNSLNGILNDDRIIYNDNDAMTTFNIRNKELIRKSNDTEIRLLFNENKCLIYSNNNIYSADLKLKENKIEMNKIYIEYILENEIYNYELEYEVI